MRVVTQSLLKRRRSFREVKPESQSQPLIEELLRHSGFSRDRTTVRTGTFHEYRDLHLNARTQAANGKSERQGESAAPGHWRHD